MRMRGWLYWLASGLCACGSGRDFTGASTDGGGDGGVYAFGDAARLGACNGWTMRDLGPGPDGVLGNTDDVERGYYRYEFDGKGRVTQITTYVAAGPDGVWETSDDVVKQIEALTMTSANEGNDYIYTSSGADGTWGTSDDTISAYTWLRFDGAGRPIAKRYFINQGADGIWDTSDDVISAWHHLAYGVGPADPIVTQEDFQQKGPDGVADTADDPIDRLQKNFRTYATIAGGPGSDGVWGTSDDDIVGEDTYSFNGDAMTTEVDVEAPGPDGAWQTADDRVGLFAKLACLGDSADILVVDAGPDQQMGTTDDVIRVHEVIVGCGFDGGTDIRVCGSTTLPPVGATPN